MNSGDYLISVGAAEELINGTVIPMDRRYDSIHVHVVNGRISYGLVDLKWNISDFDATEVQSDAIRSALAAQSTVQADRP